MPVTVLVWPSLPSLLWVAMKVVDGVRAIGARANAEACALAEAELGGLQHWEEVWWQGALE